MLWVKKKKDDFIFCDNRTKQTLYLGDDAVEQRVPALRKVLGVLYCYHRQYIFEEDVFYPWVC